MRANVCVKKICGCSTCLQIHWFRSAPYYRRISCSLPNNITNVIIYPKTSLFRKAGIYFAWVYCWYYYYFNAWHSLLQCSFMQPLWKKNVSTIHMLFLCSFTRMNNLILHNILIRLIVCMFVLWIAYVCVCLCYSSDLPRHVKIATTIALSARALKPGQGTKVSIAIEEIYL